MTDQADNTKLLYVSHIFCCNNEREPGHPRGCCAEKGSLELQTHFRARAKELGVQNIRVNKSGCLDRCELGPNMVIYPEGVWYSYHTTEDIDEILQTHVIGGGRVERLMLNPNERLPADRKQKKPEPAAS
ncbi:MAG: (2Fe-2S) ferredoxin domain-containing protein [Alphaproteobacteria bacterium]